MWRLNWLLLKISLAERLVLEPDFFILQSFEWQVKCLCDVQGCFRNVRIYYIFIYLYFVYTYLFFYTLCGVRKLIQTMDQHIRVFSYICNKCIKNDGRDKFLKQIIHVQIQDNQNLIIFIHF